MKSLTTNENAPLGGAEFAKTTQSGFSYPKPGSVKGGVLGDLLSGMQLTHLDVWERCGSSRAAHHILMLRRAGWPIETRDIQVPTKDGRTATIAEYVLPPSTIAEAGDQGLKYVAAVRATRAGQ